MHIASHRAARARRRVLMLITSGALSCAVLLLASTARATTTGSGSAATEVRAVSGFQTISLRGGIDVVVRQGNSERVTVRADDNILALVQTEVEGSGDTRTLRIQFKSGESVRTKTQVVVTVDVVKLEAIASSGSSDITIEALKTPALTMSISGSSDVTLKQLDTERLGISIAGSGDVFARALQAGDVSVSIAGSGDASVTAQRTISVAIALSGDVDYGGGAALAKSSISGSGAIRQRQP